MKNSILLKSPQTWLLLSVLLYSMAARAQTIRGTVHAADDGLPITGATVNMYASKSDAAPVSLATNPDGGFAFEKMRIGYYRCEVIALGYETKYLTELQVVAGKEQVLDIELRRNDAQLPEVTIAATQSGRRPQQPMSEIPLTRDQTLRFPAMFFDPGRLAAAYPGVSQVDDGTNMMSIRGNSPAMVRWRIEGLDIVNPNHLPNAGTLSDAPAAASGGVLMFSAQMLDNSSLLTGAYPAGYGDAVAGVMDMNLRSGNTRHHEFTVQAGLVGLDLAAEGPMPHGKDNSYLFNYRYSTVGLLGQLGVSFGDEQINFQDLSFKLHLTGKKGGQYAIFGLGGLSENVFRHKQDTVDIKHDKDRFDIDFQSRTGALGGTGKWKLSPRTWLKAALVYSSNYNNWQKKYPSADFSLDYDIRVEERIGGSLEWHAGYQRSQLSAGIQAYHIFFNGDVLMTNLQGPVAFHPYIRQLAYINLQPWLRWDWTAKNGRLNAQLGAQFHYNNVYHQLAPAPRGLLAYRLAAKHKIALTAGLYKQDAPVWLQYTSARFISPDYHPPYISSFQTGFRYTWSPSLFWKVSAELFHQATENLPADPLSLSSFFNTPEYISELSNTGTSKARNNGFELGVERSLQSGWFFAANASLIRSKYQVAGNDWLDSRWNIGHLSNVTFGKEWQREKTATLTRTIGVGLRTVWSGGPREADINFGASLAQGRTVYNDGLGYDRQYPDYFRADLRVYWKRNLGDRRNSTFALDLQNLTGQQNLAYHYYDPFTQKVENKYQLGTIPNFSWRMEF